jgi:hypothetical protein
MTTFERVEMHPPPDEVDPPSDPARSGYVIRTWLPTPPSPEPWWIEAFRHGIAQGDRPARGWVLAGAGDPVIDEDGRVQWSIPVLSQDAAWGFVNSAALYANSQAPPA